MLTAQPTPEASRAQAAAALDVLLDTGNRRDAVEAALAGLPDAPTEDSLAAYGDAMEALARAIGNRSIEVGDGPEGRVYLTPDGTRALFSRNAVDAVTPDTPLRVQLHDARTGAPIGQPITSSATVDLLRPAAADIDLAARAGLFSVYLWSDAEVRVHRIADGAPVARVQAVRGLDVRLAPDGRHLAVALPPAPMPEGDGGAAPMAGVEIRRVADGATVATVRLAEVAALDWADAASVVAASIDRGQPDAPSLTLLRIDFDGARTEVAGDVPFDPWALSVAADGAHVLVQDGSRARVFGIDGAPRLDLQLPAGLASFARGGDAVAIPDYAGNRLRDLQLALVDLDGTPLPATPGDYIPFDSFAYGPDGRLLGTPDLFRGDGAVFDGGDLPQGPALIRAARGLLRGGPDPTGPTAAGDARQAMSRAHAERAAAALRRGDRRSALIAALQGLPDDPDDADFARFDAAHLMLYRAMAARTLRLPGTVPVAAMLDPTGTRMAVGSPGATLYEMPGGRAVTPLLRPDGSPVVTAGAPAFDPAGRRLAVLDGAVPAILFYDARSGALLRSVPLAAALQSETPDLLLPAGFSHDGGLFAVETDSDLILVTPLSGDVERVAAGGIPLWLPGRRLLLVEPVFAGPDDPVARVALRDGAQVTALHAIAPDPAGLRVTPIRAAVNRPGTALLLEEGVPGANRAVGIDGAGELRAVLDLPSGPVEFLRGGTALGVLRGDGLDLSDLDIRSLQGAVLTPRIEDFAIFDQGVVGDDGTARLAGPMPPGAPRYRAGDLPRGRALWEAAMAEIGAAGRAEVAARRIATDEHVGPAPDPD